MPFPRPHKGDQPTGGMMQLSPLSQSGPVRMAPICPEGPATEPAVLRKAPYNVPSIIPNVLQQGVGRRPGVEQHIGWAATQPMARVAGHSREDAYFEGPTVCHSRRPSGIRLLSSVQSRRTKEKPYPS